MYIIEIMFYGDSAFSREMTCSYNDVFRFAYLLNVSPEVKMFKVFNSNGKLSPEQCNFSSENLTKWK